MKYLSSKKPNLFQCSTAAIFNRYSVATFISICPQFILGANDPIVRTEDSTIYIPITDNLSDAVRNKIIEMAGTCTVEDQELISNIKSRLKLGLLPEKIQEIIDDQLATAQGIITDYNAKVKKAGDDAADKVKSVIDESAPSLKVENKYKYKQDERDPGQPGWGESTLDIEGTHSASVTFGPKAKISLSLDVSVLVAGGSVSFDVQAESNASYNLELVKGTASTPSPVDKPSTKAGGTWLLKTSWSVTAGATAAAGVNLGAGSSSSKTSAQLTGDMTAGTVASPP